MCLSDTVGRKAWKVYELISGELYSVCYDTYTAKPTNVMLTTNGQYEDNNCGFHLYANRSDARKALWFLRTVWYSRKFVMRQVEYFNVKTFGTGDGGFVNAFHEAKNALDKTHALQDPSVPVIVSTKIRISGKNFR